MTKAIAVTAHHDDAVLWLGGTILRTRPLGWSWAVVALCVPDRPKQEYFQKYCAAVGATPHRFPFRDYQEGPRFRLNQKLELQEAISRACDGGRFDWVFTHNRDERGEYGGHANHDEVREATRELVQAGGVCAGPSSLGYFAYSPIYGGNGLSTVARPQADFYVQLTYDELTKKCEWCRSAPDAGSSLANIGFPCPNPEAFAGDNLQLPEPFIPRRTPPAR